MGSPVSPAVADIFMQDLEVRVFAQFLNPARLWKRFVDDILSIVRCGEGEKVLEQLEKQHPSIRFTVEEESEGELPYMDVKFERQEDGKLRREVHRKKTHTDRYLQFSSNHTDNVKSGVIQGLVDRAGTVSSDQRTYRQEVGRIISIFRNNGYPRKFVERTVKKTREVFNGTE